jgi:hypothetical protein
LHAFVNTLLRCRAPFSYSFFDVRKQLILVAFVVAIAAFLAIRSRRGVPMTAPGQTFDYRPRPQVNPGGVLVRPMDADIFGAIEKGNLTRAQLLDLFPDRPYHVKLVADGGDRRVNFVLIDLQRAGHWDERWEIKPDGVFRHTASGSPTDVMFTLRVGHWIPH